MHSLTGEMFQDMIVASYAARPEKRDTWDEQARLLIKYYNARALVENDEVSFIDFMKAKGDQHYLEPQPMWLKMVIPNSTVSREYGLSRAAEKVRDHLHGILKAYSEEELIVEKNDKDEVVKRMIGMYRIPDPMLLEEMIQYTEDGNFDRIVAAELALAQAKYMDPIFGKVNQEKDSRILSLGKKHIIPSVFGSSKPAFFRQKRNKLFL